MPSPILARADALMRRQRASDGDAEEIPVLTDAFDGDDIPLLLDIDAAPEKPSAIEFAPATEAPCDLAPPEPTFSLPASPHPETVPAHDDAEDLLRELSDRLRQRLTAELPRLIDATLRDYLAERAMLADLPPEARE